MRKIIRSALVIAAAATAAGAQAKAPIVLKSIEVTLPDSSRTLPDGTGLAAVQNNCLACHSAGMILNQPAMAKAAWEAEVAKMRNVYKAPIAETEVPAIVDYLTAAKGPK